MTTLVEGNPVWKRVQTRFGQEVCVRMTNQYSILSDSFLLDVIKHDNLGGALAMGTANGLVDKIVKMSKMIRQLLCSHHPR